MVVSVRARAQHVALCAAHSAVFEGRRNGALCRVQAVLSKLEIDPQQRPLVLQQLCHKNRTCDGLSCAGNEEPIYGTRYACRTCETDYCGACWGSHNKMHVIEMYQHVLPEDAAVPSDTWTIRGIRTHKESSAGREYLVIWEGPWADEWQLRDALNNDTLVDA